MARSHLSKNKHTLPPDPRLCDQRNTMELPAQTVTLPGIPPPIPRKGFSSLTMSLSGKVHALNSNRHLISSTANLQMKSPETLDGGKQAWQGEDQGIIQKRTKDSKGTSCGSFVPHNTR